MPPLAIIAAMSRWYLHDVVMSLPLSALKEYFRQSERGPAIAELVHEKHALIRNDFHAWSNTWRNASFLPTLRTFLDRRSNDHPNPASHPRQTRHHPRHRRVLSQAH